ncbi:MAG: transposase [Candidatus Competibacteraceae bacterium]
MTIYPEQQKESLVKRMLPPRNANVPKRSRETGIPQDTLYGWRRQAQRAHGLTRTPAAGSGECWSSEEKFAMVVETAALSEVERGEYCRNRGRYPEHLQAWRRACEQANRGTPAAGSGERSAERRRIRELEAEWRRKDQALAETAAWRVLRKPAQAIWGEAAAE